MQFEGQEEPVEVELDSELEDGATTVSFEYDGHTYEDVELAEEFTVEPAVESVSAINATTVEVELNRELSEEEALTYTFDGSEVAAENVTVDGTTTTLTVPTMEDDSENAEGYTLVASDSEGNELYNDSVVYDANELTSLTTGAETSFSTTVGEEATVTYTLQDEDEDPVADEDVRVRATNANGDVVEEQVLTTDSEGQVNFSYSQVDGGTHSISAVALNEATLRDNSVNIEWVETAASISVANPENDGFIAASETNVDSETQTAKYVATFTDENGDPLEDGKNVYVSLDGATQADLSSVGDDEFIGGTQKGGANSTLYEVTLSNGDGTAVLEFTHDSAANIKPTFYQDADQDAGSITSTDDFTSSDARIDSKEVEIVDGTTQEANYELSLVEEDGTNDNVQNTDDGVAVEQSSNVEYNLKATDQYGNPFVGVANLSHAALLDNVAGNDASVSDFQFDIAEDDDSGVQTDVSSVEFGSQDNDGVTNDVNSNGDSVVRVKVNTLSNSVGDTTNLVVWQDVDNEGYSSNQPQTESGSVEVVQQSTDFVESVTSSVDGDSVFTSNALTHNYQLLNLDRFSNSTLK